MTIREAAAHIKQVVTSRQIAEHYGFVPDRGGYIPCPFHHEKTGSLKLHDSGWYCYGCHKGGDAVEFVKLYENVGFNAAVAKVNDYFMLGLLKAEKISVDDFLRKRKDKARQEALEALCKAQELSAVMFIDQEWCEAWSAYRDAHSTPVAQRTAAQWWAMVEAEDAMQDLDRMREAICSGHGQMYVDVAIERLAASMEKGKGKTG